MNKKYTLALFLAIPLFLLCMLVLYLMVGDANIQVLNPQGIIGQKQHNLLIFGATLSLLVVVPVFVLTFWIAWRYRQGNHNADYKPNWDRSVKAETIWWVGPIILIAILSVVTYVTSHSLNPYKPLTSNAPPLTVQVIALQWKWLFIYPEQNIASVNFVQFPVDRPVNFQITSDAPMNSFWIPQLGGQIYAMSGMSTQLHLAASKAGDYSGYSANLSGQGFAGMRFTARASNERDFATWVQTAQRSAPETLNATSYQLLAEPSEDNPATLYAPVQNDLYNSIVMKYMGPKHTTSPAKQPTSDGHTYDHMESH